MKFSLIFEAQLSNPTREREHRLLQECVEQSVYAEAMGFDRVWAVEHHSLKYYAHMSAPEIFLTWVAAKTSRIRIGHGVVCMPFGYNHPIRVGERVAMLDALSGGRLDVGGGRGASLQEMSLVGVDPDDTYPQLYESLCMLGHMRLYEQSGPFRIDARGQQADGHLSGPLAQRFVLVFPGNRVQVHHTEQGLIAVLKVDPVPDCPQPVADMQLTGGLNS